MSLCSIVRYEMQRRESTTPGFMMAPVGQASMHLVQLPQTFPLGFLGEWDQREVEKDVFEDVFSVRSRVVITSARKTQEPYCSVIRHPFLPMRPRPDCSARARSRSGPVSTYHLC